MQLSDIKHVHMIGIKGTGMSALALMLTKFGIRVSGSDTKDSFLLLDKKNFVKNRIKIFPEFKAKNISKEVDLAIVSTSHNKGGNPEVKEIKRRGIKLITYPQMLSMITRELPSIAIIGSHGKTTTTNLLGHIALNNGIRSAVLSGPTSQQVLNEAKKDPESFIFEADEYENKLRHYNPQMVILTSVDYDHPDFFKTPTQYKNVFKNFIKRIPKTGLLIYCADDKNVREVAKLAKCKTLAYGISSHAKIKTRIIKPHLFEVLHGRNKARIKTPLIGTHNSLNATAVLLASRELGITNKQFQKSLSTFKGSPRRLEKISTKPLIYDDYGHHPNEIRAAIRALRDEYPKHEIWTVFQPHTYTRTKKFLKEFGKSFEDSDHTIVLDIWGSAREDSGMVHSTDLMFEIGKNGDTVYHLPSMKKAARFLKNIMKKDTLILTIGAGDIWKIHELLV
ncbi:MAG: UDP-N-acetylmuramate--L-alanine ligase [Parcubacteria group bacterium]